MTRRTNPPFTCRETWLSRRTTPRRAHTGDRSVREHLAAKAVDPVDARGAEQQKYRGLIPRQPTSAAQVITAREARRLLEVLSVATPTREEPPKRASLDLELPKRPRRVEVETRRDLPVRICHDKPKVLEDEPFGPRARAENYQA